MPTKKKVDAPKKELKKAATTRTAATKAAKTATPKGSKGPKPNAKKTPKAKKLAKGAVPAKVGVAQLISSEVVFQGALFRVLHDKIIEPSGKPNDSAKKWKPLVEYFASPGFLGESMKVFVAEGLVAGDAHPEEDEEIEFRLVKLSDVLKMIEKGAIKDGKTLTSVLLYARLHGGKGKK